MTEVSRGAEAEPRSRAPNQRKVRQVTAQNRSNARSNAAISHPEPDAQLMSELLKQVAEQSKNIAEQSKLMLEQSKQINVIQQELITIQQEIKTKETVQNPPVHLGYNSNQQTVVAKGFGNSNAPWVNPNNQWWNGQPSGRFQPGSCRGCGHWIKECPQRVSGSVITDSANNSTVTQGAAMRLCMSVCPMFVRARFNGQSIGCSQPEL